MPEIADRPIGRAPSRQAAIRAEMAPWLEGEVIAQKEIDPFGTVVAVVARNEDGAVYYSVIRGFWLGDWAGAGVSVDFGDGTLSGLVGHLLGKYGTE